MYTERAKVREKVQALLGSGVIQESDSDYAKSIILVPKKNGDVRMCVDYQALNCCIVNPMYPLPLVNNKLDKLAGKVASLHWTWHRGITEFQCTLTLCLNSVYHARWTL